MSTTTLTTTGDATDRTAAVLAEFTSGNDVKLGPGQFDFANGLVPTGDHNGRKLLMDADTSVTRASVSEAQERDGDEAAIDLSNTSGFVLAWDGDFSAINEAVGPQVDPSGAYNAVLMGDYTTVVGIRGRNASFKCFNGRGLNPTLTDFFADSDKGNQNNDPITTDTTSRYPTAVQFDRASTTRGGTATVKRGKFGRFAGAGTAGGGPGIKIAGYAAVLEDFEHLYTLDRWNGYTLILAELVGRVVGKRLSLPGGIAHFPDSTYAAGSYANMLADDVALEDVLIGPGESGHGQVGLYFWNGFRCKRASLSNVAFSGIRRAAIDLNIKETGTFADAIPADELELLDMQDARFETWKTLSDVNADGEPMVIALHAEAAALTGRITHTNTIRRGPNTNGVRWSSNAGLNTLMDGAASVVRNTPASRRAARIASLSPVEQWDFAGHPRGDGATIAGTSTNLTVSVT